MNLLLVVKLYKFTNLEESDFNSVKDSEYCISSGVHNSSKFIVGMLRDQGFIVDIITITDDAEIHEHIKKYDTSLIIFEAFWISIASLDYLTKTYPDKKWIIRNHSNLPFLSQEGGTIELILKYLKRDNVYIASISKRAFDDTIKLCSAMGQPNFKVLYLPTYYSVDNHNTLRSNKNDKFNVGCFGAIRPFKNHLTQAVAAIKYAHTHNKILKFHINTNRVEDMGWGILENLRGLFSNLDITRYRLVEHGWLNHDDFLKLVSTMDIGLQVSFTETFNIVAADFVSQGIPIVVSKQIDWLPKNFVADPTDANSIYFKMESLLNSNQEQSSTAFAFLKKNNESSINTWVETLGKLNNG